MGALFNWPLTCAMNIILCVSICCCCCIYLCAYLRADIPENVGWKHCKIIGLIRQLKENATVNEPVNNRKLTTDIHNNHETQKLLSFNKQLNGILLAT
jgi:hypothetical protein